MSISKLAESAAEPVASPDPGAPVLRVEGLSVQYGSSPAAVTDVDFEVGAGEVVGLIGESGCGKSSIALAVLGLLPTIAQVRADRMQICGQELLGLDESGLNRIRGNDASIIFQEPMSSLNPCMRIGVQIAEGLRIHTNASKAEAAERAVDLLRQVQVPEPELRARQYPHELSGGMRQRVVIAMAMAASPRLLVADEPTTALDVTIQAQILDLLAGLRGSTGMGMLLISHDLGIVAETCDRVLVMYAGHVVEEGPPDQVLAAPTHPYTRALLDSLPRLTTPTRSELPAIAGSLGDEDRTLPGCRFQPRCRLASAGCEREQHLVAAPNGNRARCWRTTSGDLQVLEEVGT